MALLRFSKRKSKRKLVDTSEFFSSPLKRSLYAMVKPGLERVLGIKKLNRIYQLTDHGATDPAVFAEEVFKELGVTYTFDKDRLEEIRKVKGPLVAVCNHPFGGLEALFLVLLMSKIRPDYKIMANYMLGRVQEVGDKLIFVDPFDGEDSKAKNSAPMKRALEHLRNSGFLGLFPSGEVAALKFNGKIKEPEWNPHVARLIQKTGASVLPVYFHGYNSSFFQLASLIHPRVRTGLLIREFVNPSRHRIQYELGDVINPERMNDFHKPEDLTRFLRMSTYILGTRYPRRKLRLSLNRMKLPIVPRKEQDIIPPIPVDILIQEVDALRTTGKLLSSQKEFEIFCFRKEEAPMLMREVGRVREITYRAAGEGTGTEIDLDEYDDWYDQLVIWNWERTELVGAYRLARTDEILKNQGREGLYTYSLFRFDPKMFEEVSPALELGRSFVRIEYQKQYWPLLLLWTGIGQFLVKYPHYKWLMGAVSISPEFHEASQCFIITFLEDQEMNETLKRYVHPKNPFRPNLKYRNEYYASFSVKDMNDLQVLIAQVEKNELKIPVLLRHYLKLGGKLLAFNVDTSFNDTLDGLMTVNIPEAPPDQLRKFMGNEGYEMYLKLHKGTVVPEEA
jgi:putative hemolysin